ncbi:hypothetical protein SAMN05216388_10774 [Halorientalis persicus]|uniref:Sulfatase n=1 Tax=Halorientalis persicus TaxID=1367881 RepID=A0A1H8WTZ6_9EURY|nr:hypothetical protein [Halorientalis persicus]SEP31126.1 hypothetical protein SAMN05216388_10774 [Halorientalis persicus]
MTIGSRVTNVLSRPDLYKETINQIFTELNRAWFRIIGPPETTSVMEKKWDTLILLDCARYDYFSDFYEGEGHLTKRRTNSSHSSEFAQYEFAEDTFHDTVYVTGNPFIAKLDEDTFHKLIMVPTEMTDGGAYVSPETTAELAKEAHENHPDKRIIVHFMQPHEPYLGEVGRSMSMVNWGHSNYPQGDTTRKDLRAAYRENLEIVWESVENLLNKVSGRISVTADHGKLLGERQQPIPVRGYSHMPGLYVPELVDVPWLQLDGEPRSVTEDQPGGIVNEDGADEAKDRLKALGYI